MLDRTRALCQNFSPLPSPFWDCGVLSASRVSVDLSLRPTQSLLTQIPVEKSDPPKVVDKYYPKKIVEPCAKMDANIDPKIASAATIAEERAHAHLAFEMLAFC